MEKVKEFIADIVYESGKGLIKTEKEMRELKSRLNEYFSRLYNLHEMDLLSEEIDMEGLHKFVVSEMISDMQKLFFDKKCERDKIKKNILRKSISFSSKISETSSKNIMKIVVESLNIAENFYREQIDKYDLFVSSIIVDDITKEIICQNEKALRDIAKTIESRPIVKKDERMCYLSFNESDYKEVINIRKILEDNNIPCTLCRGELAEIAVISFISKDSLSDDRILMDLEMAWDKKIVIIPVILNNCELNDVFKYYINPLMCIKIVNISDLDDFIQKFQCALAINYYNQKILGIKVNTINKNIDIQSVFCEVINKGITNSEYTEHQMNYYNQIGKKIIEHWGENTETITDILMGELKKCQADKEVIKRLKILDKLSNEKLKICFNNSEYTISQGRMFSIIDPHGTKTLAFQVYRGIDIEKLSYYYILKELSYAEKVVNNGRKITIFVDNLPADKDREIQLILCNIDSIHCVVTTTIAMMGNDTVKILKKPMSTPFSKLYNNYEEMKNSRNENLSNDKIYEIKGDQDLIMIDPVNSETIPRNEYYDDIQKRWRVNFKVLNNKSYLAMKVLPESELRPEEFDVGYGYFWGDYFLPRDIMKAIMWFERSEDPRAINYLANILLKDDLLKDVKEGIRYLEKAANLQLPEAQFLLGKMYLEGKECKINKSKALSLFRKSAKQGLISAQIKLGIEYLKGDNVRVDEKKAFKWFLEAAKGKSSRACKLVGDLYYLGRGVEPDISKALEWYKVSDEADAKLAIGDIYYKGIQCERDYKKALYYYLVSARGGNTLANVYIGVQYLKGEGVKRCYSLAYIFFKRAADLSCPNAYRHLGDMYANGIGVIKSEGRAIKLYKKAIELGDNVAEQLLNALEKKEVKE